jgi:hypothetical protein
MPSGLSGVIVPRVVVPGGVADLTVAIDPNVSRQQIDLEVSGEAAGVVHGDTAELDVRRARGTALILNRFRSAQPLLLLTALQQVVTETELKADVTLHNMTGTWVKAHLNVTAGQFPVSTNERRVPGVVLLGPSASLKLGRIEFRDGEYLQYDGTRVDIDVAIALMIDLFLRGTLGRQLPTDAFVDAFAFGELAFNLAGDVFRAIGAECRDLAFRLGFDVAIGDADETVSDAARLFNCSGVVKGELFKLVKRSIKDQLAARQFANYVEENFDTLLQVLRFPENAAEFANLMCPSLGEGNAITGFVRSLALCTSVGSPLEGVARLEAE